MAEARRTPRAREWPRPFALKRERAPLARDIIFLAVAAEEVSSVGTNWMIQHKRELLAGAEYLINEGSANVIEGGEVPLWGVDVAEKMPFWLRLTARGMAGHSSVPARDATTHRLARAVARVVNYETPLKVLPLAQRELCEQARVRFPHEVERFCRLEKSLGDPAFRKRLTENPEWNYLLRNTISLTVMRGGPQTNVIPAEASAELDVRRSEEHTSELQSPCNLVCRLLLEKKKKRNPPVQRRTLI